MFTGTNKKQDTNKDFNRHTEVHINAVAGVILQLEHSVICSHLKAQCVTLKEYKNTNTYVCI